jgi:hypothetical protein
MTDETMTDEYPTITSGVPSPERADGEPTDDDEWPVRGSAKAIRLRLPVAALVTVLLVAAGFWGGAIAEKAHGGSSSSAASGLAARFRSGAAGGAGAGAAAGGGFAGGGFRGGAAATGTSAAAGTISVVSGNTLYVLTSTGSLVKVTFGQSTAVTRNAKTAADALRPGDSVVVQGAAAKNGDVTATSVASTAPGVTPGAGG